ncbi:alpha/beta hydrolase [Mollicutes bacterium LVI A0078]|nr:alpha/beta hydrolase [Mollicutes bacterium LVI A0075]WOO90836.1 alpha/beta hydrolase [Mollicutes bacterium LVI A0078]
MRKKSEINNKILSYIEVGKGQNIIFLHGWGRTGDDFMPLIESLGDNYHMFAIDLPGHGLSEEPSGDLTLDGMADTVKQFIELNNIEDPILVCHSFGARIAIKLAITGVVTNKLIFTGGAGIEKKSIGFKIKVLNYKFMKLLVKTPFYSQYRDDLFANSGSADYKNASPVMKKVMSLAVSEDLSNVLTKINNQTLLYWGSADDATPLWHGEMMNERIENSTLIVKEGLTHYAFLESVDQFNQTVNQFLGGELNE